MMTATDHNDVTQHALEARDGRALVDFAARLEALSPDAWERITARCTDLDSPDFGALVKRAGHRSGIVASMLTSRLKSRGVSTVPMTALAVAFAGLGVARELAAEFEPSMGKRWVARRERVRARATPERRPRADAWLAISTMAEERRGRHPGVAAAIHGAALAVSFRRNLTDAELAAAYAPFEAEIPLETLGAAAGTAAGTGAESASGTASVSEGLQLVRTSSDPAFVADHSTDHAMEAADAQALAEFAARLEALTPDAWDRIAGRCAELDSPDFAALLHRAGHLPKIVTSTLELSPLGRAIAVAAFTSFGVAWELALEFGASREAAFVAARDRARGREGTSAAGVAGLFSILAVAESRRVAHPGVALAIRDAAFALMARREMPEWIAQAYAPFEAEIPLATLAPSGTG